MQHSMRELITSKRSMRIQSGYAPSLPKKFFKNANHVGCMKLTRFFRPFIVLEYICGGNR